MPDIELSTDLIALLAMLSALPFIVISATSFVKIAVVFSLLRNALGIQQIPPNIVLYSLALIITVYVMMPTGFQVYRIAAQAESEGREVVDFLPEAAIPLRDFMAKHVDDEHHEFFKENVEELWEGEGDEAIDIPVEVVDLIVLLPAFTTSQLKEAFEIGFLIYLPFIAIDLVVSNILLALGMMMLSPVTISLPFKLLLFVAVDGWVRLIQGLVLSYV